MIANSERRLEEFYKFGGNDIVYFSVGWRYSFVFGRL